MTDYRDEPELLALREQCRTLEERLAEAQSKIASLEEVIRLELLESNDIGLRLTEAERALRVFHPMIDPSDATPEESALWHEWQTRLTDSASQTREPPCPHGKGWEFCEKCVEGHTVTVAPASADAPREKFYGFGKGAIGLAVEGPTETVSDDPSPWCSACGNDEKNCRCGPIARNE